MGSYIEDDAIHHGWRLIQDEGDNTAEQLVTNEGMTDLLRQVEWRYSQDRPLILAEDLSPDGTNLLSLPASWTEGLSVIQSIENPIGSVPLEIRDPRTYQLYRQPSSWKLLWLDGAPSAGSSTVRITYTAKRSYHATVPATTTVLDADHHAVCCLLASLACDTIAAKFARTHEPIIAADVTSYRTKQQEWQAVAKRFYAMYADHLGLGSGNGSGESTVPGSSVWVNWDNRQSWGGDFLTHPRRDR